MLNYVSLSVLSWAASGPLKLHGSPLPITADVGAAALPILFGRNGHLGVVIAFLAVPIVWFFLYRTIQGFEVRTVGANPDAARYAGMHPKVVTVFTMGLAGGLAGLAGTGDLLGISHQMSASYGTTVGFDSITVALLGRSHPVGVMLSALLFGAMRSGSGQMQVVTRLPTELVDVVEAVLLLFLVIGPVLGRVLRLRSGPTGIEAAGGAIAPAAAGKAVG
jgi:simple sugar transport system permease protein